MVSLVEKHLLEKFPFLASHLPFWASLCCVTWCALPRRTQHRLSGCSSCCPWKDISRLHMCFSSQFTHSPGLSWSLLRSGSTHTPSILSHIASEPTLSSNFRAEIKKRERGTLTGPWEKRLIENAASRKHRKAGLKRFLVRNRKE